MGDHVFAFGDPVAVPETCQWSFQDEFFGVDSMKPNVGIQVDNVVQFLRPFWRFNFEILIDQFRYQSQ